MAFASPPRSRGRNGTEQADSSTPLSRVSPTSRRGLDADRDTWRLSSPPNARKNVWEALASGLPTSQTGRSPALLSRALPATHLQVPPAREEVPLMLPQAALANYLPQATPASSSPGRALISTRSPTRRQTSSDKRLVRRMASPPSSSPKTSTQRQAQSSARSSSPPRFSTQPQAQSSARLLTNREGSPLREGSPRLLTARHSENSARLHTARRSEGSPRQLTGRGSEGGSHIGASARSQRSAQAHGWRVDWFDDIDSEPATTPQTSVGGQICHELRWLRKSSALVSKYDAVLNAKVERMQQVRESRRARKVGETKAQIMSRFTNAKSWFVEKLCARNSLLLLATIIAGWVEIALRPHAIEEIFAAECLRTLKLYYFFFWRRGAGCQHADMVMEKLRDEMRRYQEAEQAELEDLQRRRARIEQHSFKFILEALGRSLGTHLDVFRPQVFKAWRDIVTMPPSKQQPAVQPSIRLGGKTTLCTSIILMAHFCSAAAYLRSWQTAVRSKKKALRLNFVMTKALLVMKGAADKDVVRLMFDNWHWCLNKRRKSFDPAISADSLVMQLFIVKEHSKTIRMKYAEQSMMVFSELTKAGMLAKAFRSWRSITGEVLAEERLELLSRQLEEASAGTGRHAISVREAVARDIELLRTSNLFLHFVTWLRVALKRQQEKLSVVLGEHARLDSGLRAAQHRVREQTVSGAAVVIAAHLTRWVRVAQHCALEQLSLGVKRVMAGRLCRDAEAQRHVAFIEERQTLAAMRVQARQRRMTGAHFATNFVVWWYVELRRIFLRVWAAAAADLAVSRRWEQRMENVEAQRTQMQAIYCMKRIHRKRAVEALLADISHVVDCRKAWNSWTQSLFAKQCIDELEEQQRRIKKEEEGLCADTLKKKREVLMPMLESVANYAGTKEGALERKIPIIFKEWHRGAKLLKIERRQQEVREFARDVAVDLAAGVDGVIERILLGRVMLSWHLDASLAHLEKDKAESLRRRADWDLIVSRLRKCVRAATALLERRNDADLCSVFFIKWRRVACVFSVERTGKEVRLALDDRIKSGRSSLESEQILLEKALIATHWRTGGFIFIAEMVAKVVFPAWRLYTAGEHSKRSCLMDEEERFQQIEAMQQRSLSYCLQWSVWAAHGSFSVLEYSFVVLLLRDWRLAARAQRMSRRRRRRANNFNVAAAKVLVRSQKLRSRAFTGWHRVLQSEAKLSLEAKLRDLEDLFIRKHGGSDRGAAIRELAEMEDASSSDESDDSSSSTTTLSQSSPASSSRGNRVTKNDAALRNIARVALAGDAATFAGSQFGQPTKGLVGGPRRMTWHASLPGSSPALYTDQSGMVLDSSPPTSLSPSRLILQPPNEVTQAASRQLPTVLDSSPPTSLSPSRLILQPPNEVTQAGGRQLPTSPLAQLSGAHVPTTTYQHISKSPFPYPWTQLPAVSQPSRSVLSSPVQARTGQAVSTIVVTSPSTPTKMRSGGAGIAGTSGAIAQAPPQILVQGTTPMSASQQQLQGVTVGLRRGSV